MVPQLGVQVFYPYGMGRGGGGKLLPEHYIKLNKNDVLTTCKVIIKGLVSGFASDHAYDVKTKGRPFWEEQNHGGHCFSLLYFGNSQTY